MYKANCSTQELRRKEPEVQTSLGYTVELSQNENIGEKKTSRL